MKINDSFLTGTANFNAKHGCQKCTTIGIYSHTYKRVYFPNINAPRRTNRSFRTRLDKDHHKEKSPLEKLNIDMISNFPTSDSLHLLDLGIMKRCMLRSIFGESGYKHKWPKNVVDLVSRLLDSCQTHMPFEIHRAVRNLSSIRKWKGVEFRTMLLYVGMVIFKDVMNEKEYNHFLTLSCATRICMTKSFKVFWPMAQQMFNSYVKMYGELYGNHSIGSNVHLLTHIVDDMVFNDVDSLMELSAYKYENCLRLLGMKLRHGNLPLEQVSRRIIEMSQLRSTSESHSLSRVQESETQLLYPNGSSFRTIKINQNLVLSNKNSKDAWFITKTNEIVKMEFAKFENGRYLITGKKLQNKTHLFLTPMNSTRLKIFKSDGKFENELCTFDISDVESKMICLPSNENFALIPLIHTM